jgi:hypothetical protein
MAEVLIPRDEEMLGEIAELELALAKEAFSRARGSETAEEFETYSKAMQRLTRACRLSMALRDKFLRMRKQDAREVPAKRDYVRIATRKVELREAVRRVIWRERETEAEHADFLWTLLDDELDNKPKPDDWGLEPLDEDVAQLCAAFNLPLGLAALWRDLPNPPDDWEPPEDDDAEAEFTDSA